MWAISAAPLWSGTDLTHMDAQTLATQTNPEVIAVDQDALGAGIRPMYTGTNGIDIWTKPLGTWTGESQAVLLVNLSSSAKSVALSWCDLGLLPGVAVRDLWARTDLGRFADRYSVEILRTALCFSRFQQHHPEKRELCMKRSGREMCGHKGPTLYRVPLARVDMQWPWWALHMMERD